MYLILCNLETKSPAGFTSIFEEISKSLYICVTLNLVKTYTDRYGLFRDVNPNADD